MKEKVEIIKCRDCIYSRSEEVNGHILWTCICLGGLETIWGDAFCAYAERTPQNDEARSTRVQNS